MMQANEKLFYSFTNVYDAHEPRCHSLLEKKYKWKIRKLRKHEKPENRIDKNVVHLPNSCTPHNPQANV